MWSSTIAYKYIGRTASVFIHWQRQQPETGVTSTQDVAGVCRGFWGLCGCAGKPAELVPAAGAEWCQGLCDWEDEDGAPLQDAPGL